MLLNLEGKSACIFGLPDSGKSTLANFILSGYGGSAFVYDTMHEYRDAPYDRYAPEDRTSIKELEPIIRAVMRSRKYRLLLIDEANRYCPSKPHPMPAAVADLNDFRAHYDMGTLYVSRRPVQLNQDLTELAHYLILFNLPGNLDISFLNSQQAGLGEAVSQLRLYHFIILTRGQGWKEFHPIPRDFATNKKLKSATLKTPIDK